MIDENQTSNQSIALAGKRVLVTGAAGFIGFHVCQRLLAEGAKVVGLDNYSAYYDINLKIARIAQLSAFPSFEMVNATIEDADALSAAWEIARPEIVIHLAAQAGVRHSIEHPREYITSNIVGTFNILELCRKFTVDHLLVASTSSVYGENQKMPFEESDKASKPRSLYAATKGASELMGHSYSSLFGFPTTFFRFFTVYGPWGRPDMALFKFTRSVFSGEPIDIYNNGKMKRDFTYIDDLVEAIMRLARIPPSPEPNAMVPHRIVNIGKGHPDELMDLVSEVERATGKRAIKNFLPMQPGDVVTTYADISFLEEITSYRPSTSLRTGVANFVDWYKQFYEILE